MIPPKGPKIELCEECGAGVDRKELQNHKCDPKKRLDFRVRLGAFNLENELKRYLDSNEAKFFEHLARKT